MDGTASAKSSATSSVFSLEASLVIDGLEKLGPHGLGRVLLVDGQQQQEMTGEGLWHAQVTGRGQDPDCHPDVLDARGGNSLQARHKPWGTASEQDR